MTTVKYVLVWALVMALALTSFFLSRLHLGTAGPIVALGIGVTKATFIALFFMHLVEQPSVSRWAFLLGLCLAALLLTMVSLDVVTRSPVGVRQPGMDLRQEAGGRR